MRALACRVLLTLSLTACKPGSPELPPEPSAQLEQVPGPVQGEIRLRVPSTWRVPESTIAEPVPRGVVLAIQAEGVFLDGEWLFSAEDDEIEGVVVALQDRLETSDTTLPLLLVMPPGLRMSQALESVHTGHLAGFRRFALIVGPPAADGHFEHAIEFTLPEAWPEPGRFTPNLGQPFGLIVDLEADRIDLAEHYGAMISLQDPIVRDGTEYLTLEGRAMRSREEIEAPGTVFLVTKANMTIGEVVSMYSALDPIFSIRVLSTRAPSNGRIVTSISRDEIQAFIRADMVGIRACYNAALTEDPELTGRIDTRFVIESGGAVAEVEAVKSSVPDPMTKCVIKAIQRWVFPHRGPGRVFVNYPFNFVPAT